MLGDIDIDAWFLLRNLPEWANVTHSDKTMLVAGGKGLNMALGAGRLGGKVSLLSVIGDDIWGQTLMKQVDELLLRLDVSEYVTTGPQSAGEVSFSNVLHVGCAYTGVAVL